MELRAISHSELNIPATNIGVEIPSGKAAKEENFPVGSWLIAPRLRPHIAAYYAFARAADDIADNNRLTAAEKIRRLDAFAAALIDGTGDPADFGKAHRLRESLRATQVNVGWALKLIDAFRQDATKNRYADWTELMRYCNRSAVPVGRYLLDLHREPPDSYFASDALCGALQVLNHLQDCRNDYRDFNRIYLPLDRFEEAGCAVQDLNADAASPALRTVLDRCLGNVDELMVTARTLPIRLRNRRLAMEASVITRLADRLVQRLRHGDPLADRIAPTKSDFVRCGASGIAAVLLRPRRPVMTRGPSRTTAR